MRGVYYSLEAKNPIAGFMWALRVSEAYWEFKEVDKVELWVSRATLYIEKIDKHNVDRYFEEIMRIMGEIKASTKNDDTIKNLENIERQCFKLKYSLVEKPKRKAIKPKSENS